MLGCALATAMRLRNITQSPHLYSDDVAVSFMLMRIFLSDHSCTLQCVSEVTPWFIFKIHQNVRLWPGRAKTAVVGNVCGGSASKHLRRMLHCTISFLIAITPLPYQRKYKTLLSLSFLSNESERTGIKALYSFHHFRGWSMVEKWNQKHDIFLKSYPLSFIEHPTVWSICNKSNNLNRITGFVVLLGIVFVSHWSKHILSGYFLSSSTSPRSPPRPAFHHP